MLVSLMLAVALRPQTATTKVPLVIDGEQLRCYQVALDYLVTNGKWKPFPFQIEHYEVEFEGNYKYHFMPKHAPGEKFQPELIGLYGPTLEVTVDPKGMKVVGSFVK